MSANLLLGRWGATYRFQRPCDRQRAELFAGILLKIQPNAVGLQEVGDAWQTDLPFYLDVLRNEYGIQYETRMMTYKGKENYTVILYRSDRYEVVNEKIEKFSFWPDDYGYHMRLISLCKLRGRDNPDEEFILMNTHWCHGGVPQEIKEICVKESVTVFEKQKKEGCPIFFTGDFNSLPDSKPIQDFAAQTGANLSNHETIDQIYYYGCLPVGKCRIMKDDYVKCITDHGFTYVDFEREDDCSI